jgi:universal stress protein E
VDKLTSIVVAVDFSACSASALAQARRIASWNRAEVGALHVVDTLVALESDEYFTAMQESIRKELIADAERRWAEFVRGLATPGAGAGGETPVPTFCVRVGSRVIETLGFVRERKAELLVLGTQGDGGGETGGGGGVGPFAAQCVRESPSDVLLVRREKAGGFRHVVAAVDFSPTSRRALERAVRVCVQDNATLDVVHVFDPPWRGVLSKFKTFDTGADREAYVQRLAKRLEEFCRPAEREMQWVKPRFHLPENSSHGMGIIELAKSVQADLVVLGTRGRTSMRELLLGTTAARVVRAAACSILAVKPVG